MSRYIDADALKMDLYSIIKADCGYTADVLAGLMIAERVIDNAPTADVAPVRHGQWRWVAYDANPKIGNWHCSYCNRIPKSFQKEDFCPNCGAKMGADTQAREGGK